MLSILGEFWRFLRVRKKYWLLPVCIMMVVFGGADRADQGLGRRALHLHAVLSAGRHAHPRDFRLLPRQRRRAGRGRPHRRRGAGGALHPQEARCARFPRTPSTIASTRPGSSLDAVDHVVFYDKPFLKFERLLETYLAFAPRGFPSFRMAMPLWLREKLFQKRLLAGRAQAALRRTSTGRSGCFSPSIT